jgi:hypothetical protein
MRIRKLFIVLLIQTAVLVAALGSGCASARHAEMTNMLSAAGFTTMTPTSSEQEANFAALPPYELVRHDFNGRVIYAYADKRNGIVYKGNESNYQRLQQLKFQQRIADQQLAAAQMNQQAAWGWQYWGPPGMWW